MVLLHSWACVFSGYKWISGFEQEELTESRGSLGNSNFWLHLQHFNHKAWNMFQEKKNFGGLTIIQIMLNGHAS
jgi:hypothetical protein